MSDCGARRLMSVFRVSAFPVYDGGCSHKVHVESLMVHQQFNFINTVVSLATYADFGWLFLYFNC